MKIYALYLFIFPHQKVDHLINQVGITFKLSLRHNQLNFITRFNGYDKKYDSQHDSLCSR